MGVISQPVIAQGEQRDVLAAVLEARRASRPLIVPPTASSELPAVEVPDGHMVAFTSGSTGTQRGILRTHASWTGSLDPLTELMGLQPSDRVCVLGSVRATMGLYGAVHAMHVLGEVILADEPSAEATVAHAAPVAAAQLLQCPPAGLRLIVVAGDRVPPSLRALAERRGVEMLEYYGATELSFVAFRGAADPRTQPGLAPFPGVEVRISDGLIWARSEYLAVGYLGDQDGPGCWVDGWATVGDRGSWIGDRLAVEGRGEEAVAVGGHTVHLADVEAYLRDRADGVDLAVTAQPHEVLGSVPVGVIAGTAGDLQAVRLIARDLPPPSRPRRWILVARLPRTAAGKVDREALRRLVQDA